MSAIDIDIADTLDKLCERGYTLQHYIETAATIMGENARSSSLKLKLAGESGGVLFAALVIAQAILDGADVCTARLERIADTLDDLVDAIERNAEGGEVPTC